MRAILTKEQTEKVIAAKPEPYTTFDNCTTYSHIKYLAKAYQIIKDERYKDAALRGIDFVLSAQYPNGGWPQYYPLEENYSKCITFNDDAMTGVMKMLKDIIDDKPYYSFVDKARREKAKIAFDKGLDCILKCQIKDNGKLTGWCQQHDANSLLPAMARKYELPSICNREGTWVILFLMSIDKPSKEVINSVRAAIKWLGDSKITGIRVEEFNTPPFQTPLRLLTTDKKVVEDKNAPPVWARFYELGTEKPLFSNRQSQRLYSMAEVDRERRAYGWYTYDPQQALDAYPAWQKKWALERASETRDDTSTAGRPRHWPRNLWADYSKQPDKWYRSKEGIQIANNILSWQSPADDWPKNTSTTREPFTSDPNTIRGTFDNSATTEEIRFLARAFLATKDKRYKQAAIKAIDHILKAQYPTGGWPQYYPPDKKNYPRHITFNDNAMVRLMNLLRDVAASRDFTFLDSGRRKAAQKSFDRGIQCILKCQIIVNGKLTVWCAQHDELDYSPRPARTYELVSLSGLESAGILELLMSLDHPSPAVVRAIEAGAEWFESSRITGIRVIWANRDRTVEKDPNAPP
ncbi:MAG: pectate lyase, partial [Sedimentisphaerales bacterium]